MSPYILFLVAFAASAVLPGPEIAALLSRSLAGGIRASLPLAAGIVTGKLLMLSAALAGVGVLLATMGPAFALLKFGGAAWLCWIGIKRIRSAGALAAEAQQAPLAAPLADAGLGLAMTTSNPLALAFYLSLLPAVVDVGGVTWRRYLALAAIIVAVMALVVLGYGLVGEACRQLFRSREAKARVDRISGAIMIAAAALIALR